MAEDQLIVIERRRRELDFHALEIRDFYTDGRVSVWTARDEDEFEAESGRLHDREACDVCREEGA